MSEKVNHYLQKLSLEQFHPHALFLYRKALYTFVLLFTLIQLPAAKALWSANSIIAPQIYEGNILLQCLNLLSHPQLANYYPFFVALLIGAIAISFFVQPQRLLSILIFFAYSNLYHRTVAIQNGSSDLLHLQLFYLMLMDERVINGSENRLKAATVALSNFAFFAAQIQLCVVYFISCYYKVQGTQWFDGSAMHYALLNDEFSLPSIMQTVPLIEPFLKVLTWLTLLFQLFFPLFIWFKKFKPFFLSFGIALHLLIAVLMGIMDFGWIMLVMYLLFVSEDWSVKVKSKLFPKAHALTLIQ